MHIKTKYRQLAGSPQAKKLLKVVRNSGVLTVAVAVLFTTHYVWAYGFSTPDLNNIIPMSQVPQEEQQKEEYNWLQNPIDASYSIGDNTLFSFSVPPSDKKHEVDRSVKLTITAYSSTPGQTDSTPFITAKGTRVRDGIIATNFLPFGTKVRIPELYGDKVFVVEDRMNARYRYNMDIWMPTYHEAKSFGLKVATVEILQ